MTTRSSKTRANSEHDMYRIAAAYLQGKPQTVIAQEIGCSQQNISLRLKQIRQRWLESSLRDFNEARAEQLAKIDRVEAEYWEAWERSKRPKTRKGKKEKNGDTSSDESSVTIEERDGSPSWLAGVERCIERRCKLLGLDAPLKTEDVTPPRYDLASLSDKELTQWENLLEKATPK